jgi:8-amino-7-oxononanoate synthase
VITQKLNRFCKALDTKDLLRQRYLPSDNLSFERNDYLSLSQDLRLADFYRQGCKAYPIGSSGSMLLSGYHGIHQELEETFARFLKVDGCILFPSGYAANLALTSLLGALKTHCLIDKAVHASVYDGLAMAGVSTTRFAHNNLHDLEKKCSKLTQDTVLLTEGIFSMSGQMPALRSIQHLTALPLFVDEAHAFGVLGPQGRGAVAHHGLTQEEVPLRLVAFGKAYAGQGALVAGKSQWLLALLQTARPLMYSTALSPAYSYGLLKTLDLVRAADAQRLHLNQLVAHFKTHITNSPLTWSDSNTPIQRVHLGSPKAALHYQKSLRAQGIDCSAVRAPTVAAAHSGLRIVLNACHQPEDINRLFKALDGIYETASD